MAKWAMEMYIDTYQNLMALYGVAGTKSETEKFAGGQVTLTYEMLMPDGKALQSCTSHDLGQNFAKAFDWSVQDARGQKLYPWQNSWGFSTRCIGGLIMVHGDDNGLVLPPNIAPIQVVVVPIPGVKSETFAYATHVVTSLRDLGVRVAYDDREGESAGFKFNKWEVRGVPVRLEIGDKEAAAKVVTAVVRDTLQRSEIEVSEIPGMLKNLQMKLLAAHKKFTLDNTHRVDLYDEFKNIMAGPKGFISALWCESADCEAQIKKDTKATTRCLPFDAPEEVGVCVHCGKPAIHRWLFGQSY